MLTRLADHVSFATTSRLRWGVLALWALADPDARGRARSNSLDLPRVTREKSSHQKFPYVNMWPCRALDHPQIQGREMMARRGVLARHPSRRRHDRVPDQS